MGRGRRPAPSREASSQVAHPADAEVRRQIRERGRITFAEFTEIALYDQVGGYYTRGPLGDYFTSPEVHPAFGALLARLAHRVWDLSGRLFRFDVVELGSGNLQLAKDFTSYAGDLCEDFYNALCYLAIDRTRADKRPSGAGFEQLVACGVPLRNVAGLVLSNELVDAFPVHRFQIRSGAVQEIYVTLDGDEIQEELGEPSTPLIEERLTKLDIQLPDGFRGEVNLGVRPFMAHLAGALSRGVVLTIDYGDQSRHLYSSARSAGTLRTFQRHRIGNAPYSGIGTRDITASVDFSALEEEGAVVGLRSQWMATQAMALMALGIRDVVEQPSWISLSPSLRAQNRLAIEELVNPDGLGGFKWLFQSKGLVVSKLEELLESPLECPGCAASSTLPLSKGDRLPLGEGRHAGATFELEELWPSFD